MDMQRYVALRNRDLAGVYRSIRAMGYPASDAMHFARIDLRWDAEDGVINDDSADSVVRLRFEPEHDSYWDVYGRDGVSEKDQKEISRLIERDGLWSCVAEARASDDDSWEQADSIGMLLGIDGDVSGYGWDLRDSALRLLGRLRDEKATELAEQIGQAATYAAGDAAASAARTSARLSAMADDS